MEIIDSFEEYERKVRKLSKKLKDLCTEEARIQDCDTDLILPAMESVAMAIVKETISTMKGTPQMRKILIERLAIAQKECMRTRLKMLDDFLKNV